MILVTGGQVRKGIISGQQIPECRRPRYKRKTEQEFFVLFKTNIKFTGNVSAPWLSLGCCKWRNTTEKCVRTWTLKISMEETKAMVIHFYLMSVERMFQRRRIHTTWYLMNIGKIHKYILKYKLVIVLVL